MRCVVPNVEPPFTVQQRKLGDCRVIHRPRWRRQSGELQLWIADDGHDGLDKAAVGDGEHGIVVGMASGHIVDKRFGSFAHLVP